KKPPAGWAGGGMSATTTRGFRASRYTDLSVRGGTDIRVCVLTSLVESRTLFRLRRSATRGRRGRVLVQRGRGVLVEPSLFRRRGNRAAGELAVNLRREDQDLHATILLAPAFARVV